MYVFASSLHKNWLWQCYILYAFTLINEKLFARERRKKIHSIFRKTFHIQVTSCFKICAAFISRRISFVRSVGWWCWVFFWSCCCSWSAECAKHAYRNVFTTIDLIMHSNRQTFYVAMWATVFQLCFFCLFSLKFFLFHFNYARFLLIRLFCQLARSSIFWHTNRRHIAQAETNMHNCKCAQVGIYRM